MTGKLTPDQVTTLGWLSGRKVLSGYEGHSFFRDSFLVQKPPEVMQFPIETNIFE